MLCELCGCEFEESTPVVETVSFKEMVCPKCHKNGKQEDDVWVPTLKKKGKNERKG